MRFGIPETTATCHIIKLSHNFVLPSLLLTTVSSRLPILIIHKSIYSYSSISPLCFPLGIMTENGTAAATIEKKLSHRPEVKDLVERNVLKGRFPLSH